MKGAKGGGNGNDDDDDAAPALQNIAESDVFNEEVMPSPKEGKAKTRAKLCNMVQCSSRSVAVLSWARTEERDVFESAILLR